MRIVRAADYRRMLWKNGGGSTTEVAIGPASATLENFDWRISMARVAMPGPFSRFPGIDRTLAVIAGQGIHLNVERATVTLDTNSAPYCFSGDVDTSATLIDGPIDDLNVMSNRTRCRHRMTRHRAGETVAIPHDAETAMLMPRGGNIAIVRGGSESLVADGDTAILGRADLSGPGEIAVRNDGPVAAEIYLIAFWNEIAS